ncbi:MAG: N-6 DNA methylase [uncultured bacterium]|nr:MAG: N-6 DNA methylase [uncultured bacterium]
MANVDPKTFDLSVKNPNGKNENNLREPSDICDEITDLDQQSESLIKQIQQILGKNKLKK